MRLTKCESFGATVVELVEVRFHPTLIADSPTLECFECSYLRAWSSWKTDTASGSMSGKAWAGVGQGETRNDLSGHAEFVVQARDVAGGVHLHAPEASSPVPVPRQLPLVAGGFLNRVREMEALDGVVGSVASTEGTGGPLVAVTGGPGVGKTALVVHWARRQGGRFPDGELYADLGGYESGTPASPPAVLDGFLRALNVPGPQIPADTEGRATLFRTLVAGRRALIVLDNAVSAAQVRLLLPGSTSCAVVVTSRTRLAGLVARDGAMRVGLDVLPPAESVALLSAIIGAARVQQEAEIAAELARRCDHLPLALRIAAERVASSAHTRLADLVEELGQSQDRLSALELDEDELATVRTVFSWSYNALDAPVARAFRLLSLHPGPDLSIEAAAALLGCPVATARRLVDALVGVHLIEESARGRYAFHQLLREYARERAAHDEPEPESRAAIERLLDWYLHSAYAAGDHLPHRHRFEPSRHVAGVTPLSFSGLDDALAWCEAERANFSAVITQAAELGVHEVQWRLPLALGSFYNLRKHWSEWISSHRVGLAGAETVGELAGQGWLLTSLGTALRELGRLDEAVACQRRAAECFERTGEVIGLASACNNLAAVLHTLGDLGGALSEYGKAVEAYRAADNLHAQARAMSNQATVLTDLDRTSEAVAQLQAALALFAQTTDRHGEGFTQHNLGNALIAAGRYTEALAAFGEALALRRATGNVWGEARTLARLGACHHALGERAQAVEYLTAAVACYDRAEDPRGQAEAQQLLDEIAAENER